VSYVLAYRVRDSESAYLMTRLAKFAGPESMALMASGTVMQSWVLLLSFIRSRKERALPADFMEAARRNVRSGQGAQAPVVNRRGGVR